MASPRWNLAMATMWGRLSSFFHGLMVAAEERQVGAVQRAFPGGNPRYRCACYGCWLMLAQDVEGGIVTDGVLPSDGGQQ